MTDRTASRANRAERVEERLAVPVIVAALVSVPAVFLTTLDGRAEQAGTILNWLSLIVLTGESVLLFLLAGDRLQWLKENRAIVIISLAAIPAVVFAVGPVQLLRLVRVVGALRVIRVNRILKAGRILRARAGLDGVWANATVIIVTVVAAAFVALILADPTSQSRQFVENLTGRFGVVPVVLAGLILGAATFIVARNRSGRPDEPVRSSEVD